MYSGAFLQLLNTSVVVTYLYSFSHNPITWWRSRFNLKYFKVELSYRSQSNMTFDMSVFKKSTHPIPYLNRSSPVPALHHLAAVAKQVREFWTNTWSRHIVRSQRRRAIVPANSVSSSSHSTSTLDASVDQGIAEEEAEEADGVTAGRSGELAPTPALQPDLASGGNQQDPPVAGLPSGRVSTQGKVDQNFKLSPLSASFSPRRGRSCDSRDHSNLLHRASGSDQFKEELVSSSRGRETRRRCSGRPVVWREVFGRSRSESWLSTSTSLGTDFLLFNSSNSQSKKSLVNDTISRQRTTFLSLPLVEGGGSSSSNLSNGQDLTRNFTNSSVTHFTKVRMGSLVGTYCPNSLPGVGSEVSEINVTHPVRSAVMARARRKFVRPNKFFENANYEVGLRDTADRFLSAI